MYGRWEGELWFHRRHMWPVPSPSTPSSVASPTNSSVFIDPNSFSKAGRKIHVGDCALFKPPHDSLPFVGIIRRLIIGKENNLSLSVNWLYRPADVKLRKGASLEAAPNEVFYSFHKDEIPAASLLHPCKVTFLRKGVELPSGISSFVCRRVYDIEDKCLWWLTDQDYINERQEEVDKLINKTRVEMYGAVQTGGRSPKPLNGSNGTTSLKPTSDNVQNSSSSISSQVKSKKREHGVHSLDSVKREHLSKADDADSGQSRAEHMIKAEIAKITDKGALVDFGGVEKLVKLMRPESAEKKIDLTCRIMLVDVISVTVKLECLCWFVQLRGLPVLDEWLQEVHKGKIGDGSPKENDKSVEEFLFALLRALDRLPVNLHALQTCNVGKSVNHLRSHKNSEIQKKARSLVDTWKRRVEAEMNIIETKSGTSRGGSWPNKSVVSEASHMGSRRISGSAELGPKSSTSQPSALKIQQAKHNSGEAVKSPASPHSTKLPTVTAAGAGSSGMPLSTIKEEKNSSFSQSPNNSECCSSDHGKTGASCREDARSSAAGSSCASKISSSVTRSRKSINGFHASTIPGFQKEGSPGKFCSVNGNFSSEKGSPTRLGSERVADASLIDNGHNPRLIVRLPNTGRSPARTASEGSLEDSSGIFGKGSPLVHSEKQDHDWKARGKTDAQWGGDVPNMGTDLCQGKDGLVGPGEGKVVTAGLPCDEHCRVDGTGDIPTGESGVTLKPRKSHESAYSSINALVESCAKFSEAGMSGSVGDDVGMNLLASVAAGEMSISDVSPVRSPERNSPSPGGSCSGNDAKLRQSIGDGGQSQDNLTAANSHVLVEPIRSVDSLSAKSGSPQQVLPVVMHITGGSKVASFGCEKAGEFDAHMDSPVVNLPQNENAALIVPEIKAGLMEDASALLSFMDATNGCKDGDEGAAQSHDQRRFSPNWSLGSSFSNLKPNNRSPSSKENKNTGGADDKSMESDSIVRSAIAIIAKVDSQINAAPASLPSSETLEDEKKLVRKQSCSSDIELQKQPHVSPKGGDSSLRTTSCCDDLAPKAEEANDKEASCHEEANCSEDPSSKVICSTTSTPVSEMEVKLNFDLNEVFPIDDGTQEDVELSSTPRSSSAVNTSCPLPSSSYMNGNRPSSVTVTAAAKGPFFPSENLLRGGKVELGWKGSAATSAFRPAEPRKAIEVPLTTSNVPVPGNTASNQARHLLDFDLNVGVIEDAGQNNAPSMFLKSENRALSGGGLDLDLNSCEDIPELSVSSSSRPCIPQLPPRSLLSGAFPYSEPNPSRDFDLNNGPGLEDIGIESIPGKNGMQFLSAGQSGRVNHMDMGNFSSWFPPSNTYPPVTFPVVFPGRGEQSYPIQRMLTPLTATTSFNPEIFRGPVLSSSPAVAYPSTVPFQYPCFPFETNFPLPSNTYSAGSTAYLDSSSGGPLCVAPIPSQLVGPSSVPYRPYVMSLPGGSGNVGPDGRKWGSQGLDLNAGPGGTTDDKFPSALRQLPVTGSQALADEQLKMFHQMAGGGGVLKRKEPDGGWDGDRISYKHPSWQ